jgi:galactokinase
MVELANRESGVYGARRTGGALGELQSTSWRKRSAEGFVEHVTEAHREKTGIACATYICMPGRRGQPL